MWPTGFIRGPSSVFLAEGVFSAFRSNQRATGLPPKRISLRCSPGLLQGAPSVLLPFSWASIMQPSAHSCARVEGVPGRGRLFVWVARPLFVFVFVFVSRCICVCFWDPKARVHAHSNAPPSAGPTRCRLLSGPPEASACTGSGPALKGVPRYAPDIQKRLRSVERVERMALGPMFPGSGQRLDRSTGRGFESSV